MTKTRFIRAAVILAVMAAGLLFMTQMKHSPHWDSLSPSTNAEKFGSIQDVLNTRNESGTRFLVFDKDDYRLVPGLLGAELEAESLDELAGVIIMERVHEQVETYYNGTKGYHTAIRLTLQSARDGSEVANAVVYPPQDL